MATSSSSRPSATSPPLGARVGGAAAMSASLSALVLALATFTAFFSPGDGASDVWGAKTDGACSPEWPCVHLVAHTHLDPGWRVSFDRYHARFGVIIHPAVLSALARDPRRRFTLADTSFLVRWLEGAATTPPRPIARTPRTNTSTSPTAAPPIDRTTPGGTPRPVACPPIDRTTSGGTPRPNRALPRGSRSRVAFRGPPSRRRRRRLGEPRRGERPRASRRRADGRGHPFPPRHPRPGSTRVAPHRRVADRSLRPLRRDRPRFSTTSVSAPSSSTASLAPTATTSSPPRATFHVDLHGDENERGCRLGCRRERPSSRRLGAPPPRHYNLPGALDFDGVGKTPRTEDATRHAARALAKVAAEAFEGLDDANDGVAMLLVGDDFRFARAEETFEAWERVLRRVDQDASSDDSRRATRGSFAFRPSPSRFRYRWSTPSDYFDAYFAGRSSRARTGVHRRSRARPGRILPVRG